MWKVFINEGLLFCFVANMKQLIKHANPIANLIRDTALLISIQREAPIERTVYNFKTK